MKRKKDIRVERQTYPFFKKFILKNKDFLKNTAWELKLCKKKSMPFSDLREHQKEALLNANNEGVLVKIPDQPHFKGSKTKFDVKKPFDFFYIKCPSYVVICFPEDDKYLTTVFININIFVEEQKNTTAKSIKKERAIEIAERIIRL